MDLKKGIFEINGIEISSGTTKEMLERSFPSDLFRIVKSPLYPKIVTYKNIPPVMCGDIKARINIFFNASKLKNIEIICIEERFSNPVKEWSNEKYEQKREFHKKWLFEKLGAPNFQNEWVAKYLFDWGTISAESDPRDPTLAIIINYGDI